MKINVTFAIDSEQLKQFIEVVEKNNSTPDAEISKAISKYVGGTNGPGGDPHHELTEKVLAKCKKYKVGQLANQLLRGLLERGVATKTEIEEMQEVPGFKLANQEHIQQGDYSNYNFGLNFPLLAKEGVSDFIKAKAYQIPVKIYGETYYLTQQWFEIPTNNDRIPLENWIRTHLPKWFENASDNEREEMKKFLERI